MRRNICYMYRCCFFFFQAEDGIRDLYVTGVQTCALPICCGTFGSVTLSCGPPEGKAAKRFADYLWRAEGRARLARRVETKSGGKAKKQARPALRARLAATLTQASPRQIR